MLVVISDLHFVDGTAGKHDLRPAAFEDVFLCDIMALAKQNGAKEIKLLLLGDIVDLLRTTQWFAVDMADRPWGDHGLGDWEHFDPGTGSATERCCRKILGDIITRNQATFELFKGFKERLAPLPVELIYVPGNHDRLVNCYPTLRDRMKEELGLTVTGSTVDGDPNGNDWRYRNFCALPEYGVFARHGHEFDRFNYAGNGKDDTKGHLKLSIGDVITTEIVAQLANLLKQKLQSLPPGASDEILPVIYDIDNIRPWTSILGFLVTKFKNNALGWKAVGEAIETIAGNLDKIRFAREWGWSHSLSELFGPWKRIEDFLKKGAAAAPSEDGYADDARDDLVLLHADKGFRFILYGHTHEPRQIPLDHDSVTRTDSIYINTGTWRPRIVKVDGPDEEYVNLKTMTYAVFYREDEDPAHKEAGTVSFDVWTGWESKRYSGEYA